MRKSNIKKYSHGDHMAQIGRITGLLEAQNKIQQEINKEEKKLRINNLLTILISMVECSILGSG